MNSLTTIPQSIALTITPRGHPPPNFIVKALICISDIMYNFHIFPVKAKSETHLFFIYTKFFMKKLIYLL